MLANSRVYSGLKVNVYEPTHWRGKRQPTPVLLPGKSHGQRSLVGCSPWGHWRSDTTERLHFHFSLSCIEEENGNSLQCPCLENPRDGGAWWAAVYGVAQSQTRLKGLSSSSIGKNPDAGKDWRQEEKGATGNKMVGWNHRFNGHEFELTQEIVKDGEAWCATVHGGHKESNMT